MVPMKRMKRSRTPGVEHILAVLTLEDFLAKLTAEEAEETDEERSEAIDLQTVLDMFTTKLDGPQVWVSQICRESRAETLSNLDLLTL